MNLNDVRMSLKLPVSFVALSLAVALLISWMGYRDFRASLLQQQELLLETLASERAKAVQDWYERMESFTISWARNPTTITAMQGFTTTFPLLMENPTEELQQAYIADNPNPIGEKDRFDRAEATIPYNFQHEQFHPTFRGLKNRMGLYDIFLINMEGDIVYSVYKETDFATNLLTGQFQQSGLARAFVAAAELPEGAKTFEDFAPYAPSNDAPAAFVASPIVNPQGVTIGVFAVQLPGNQLDAIVTYDQGLGETGDLALVGEDLTARTSSRFDGRHRVGSDLNLSEGERADLAARVESTHVLEAGLAGRPVISVVSPLTIAGLEWGLVAQSEQTEVLARAVAQRNKTLILTSVAMIIVAGCGWLISRAFATPLGVVATAMNKISNRDYDVVLPDLSRKDEIGDLGRALTLVSDRLREFDDRLEVEKEQSAQQQAAVSTLGSALQRLAAQDFSQPINQRFADDYEQLRHDYNETVDRVGEAISNLKSFAEMIDQQTEKMGRDSNELSQRTENQASTLEETAAAIHQIAEGIAESTNDLKSAERLILETDTQVKEGRSVVENTTKAMDEIEKSADEIGSIIRVVDDIAFQTNLLALNAGVEAARAGDAGRGFAVVASEVRQLAMRSAEAVSQIKSLIQTSNANVERGVGLVRETETVLMEIVQRMEGISTAVSSVATGASEQSGSIAEINSGVTNLDRVTQQNAMMVENSNASAQSLSQEAANLVSILNAFRVPAGKQGAKSSAVNEGSFASRRG